MYHDLILVCSVRISYYRNLDKSAEHVVGQYFRILLSNVLSGKAWNLGKNVENSSFFVPEVTMIATDLCTWPYKTSDE